MNEPCSTGFENIETAGAIRGGTQIPKEPPRSVPVLDRTQGIPFPKKATPLGYRRHRSLLGEKIAKLLYFAVKRMALQILVVLLFLDSLRHRLLVSGR